MCTRAAAVILACALALPSHAAGPPKAGGSAVGPLGVGGGPPTVAVMPFRDLTEQAHSVGEAIRETVTTDLKEVPGVRVIERANLDRVLAELNLQSRRADLDPLSAVKVGKLLGATLIVAGAYQQAGSNVRLTARFVRVETGEIIGTAKVDGRTSNFLKLQDAITGELLQSAGLVDKAKKMKARAPKRAPIKSLRTLELYGEAVMAQTDADRKRLLKVAVDEDTGFEYASRDLARVEARIRRYQATADLVKEKQLEELRAEAKRETDPAKRAMLEIQLCGQLMMARRYYELKAFARELSNQPAPPPPASPGANVMSPPELGLYYLIVAENQLHESDAVLRDGEAFLERFPGSQYFPSIKTTLEAVIRERREAEAGRAKVQREMEQLSSEQKWNLCRVGVVYRGAHQLREAQRLYRACAEAGVPEQRKEALVSLAHIDIELGDWTAMRRDLEALEKVDKQAFQSFLQSNASRIPADG